MKIRVVMLLICAAAILAFAGQGPDFSGTWIFSPPKSRDIGMMSQMTMTQSIVQSASALDVTATTAYQNKDDRITTHYDLTGKPAINDSPMAGPSETVSHWNGSSVVTTWTSDGAVKGTKIVRAETRSLSPDGKTMTLESGRGSNPPVVMVFDKK